MHQLRIHHLGPCLPGGSVCAGDDGAPRPRDDAPYCRTGDYRNTALPEAARRRDAARRGNVDSDAKAGRRLQTPA